jgi:hypothetical protein
MATKEKLQEIGEALNFAFSVITAAFFINCLFFFAEFSWRTVGMAIFLLLTDIVLIIWERKNHQKIKDLQT